MPAPGRAASAVPEKDGFALRRGTAGLRGSIGRDVRVSFSRIKGNTGTRAVVIGLDPFGNNETVSHTVF